MADELNNENLIKCIGNYSLQEKIGSGSFSEVRIGVEMSTQEKVAIKTITKSYSEKRLEVIRELSILQKMNHPNIVKLFDFVESHHNFYIIMELIEGINFYDFIDKRNKFTEEETRNYMTQLVSAVNHMHNNKVIHRDLKLENMLLNRDNRIVLIDFGIGNHYEKGQLFETQCGSLPYTAPEILKHRKYGTEVDIWSLGVNMYLMLTGNFPFRIETFENSSKKIDEILAKGYRIPENVSEGCLDLLSKLLNPNQKTRIRMREILIHPWLRMNKSIEEFPTHVSNKPRHSIVDYVVQLDKCSEKEVLNAINNNTPVYLNAHYNLIKQRLERGAGYPYIKKKAPQKKEPPSRGGSKASRRKQSIQTISEMRESDNEENYDDMDDHNSSMCAIL